MSKTLETKQKLAEAMHLQAVESNPLDAADMALFEQFERDGLSPEQRRAHILAQADTLVPAAE
ncbi:hypothetical protein JQV19_06155 [Sulfitobacter mediterraneus]|uniref:hypothetical protein n=1 Tax=Sulfitobacter mediterraneus TaxID=83219 RepID=UPI00193966C3|nr:hypothetical protein [Sulfitobacter mediterraneus]MBM1556231.1 hypothetical protein [Sulfitobacter mediterraneus]MBM1567731.1 hypothetical protein [Sulfitobacter mediterraneus]MBM1571585.1 hypothetical protein [Sulfitobacter mediterraneus]MBM1575373.1 hypothetical protein [Sulfitobacter mediterraneus]MBM1579136.1 hypothetical protein [Sulfitobacter mediterraneus]